MALITHFFPHFFLQVDLALAVGTQFTCFHHHLISMLDRVTSKSEKRVFNVLTSTPAVLDYLHDNYGVCYNNDGAGHPERTSEVVRGYTP